MIININSLNTSAGTQSRVALDENIIAEYAEAMSNGAKFPPIRVYNDGVENYLADGFHRYFAVKKLGKTSIEAAVVSGTLRDAMLYSFGCNHEHGLRRSNADKRKAVTFMLDDIEWSTWSDSEIARACNVSQVFVSKLRAELDKIPEVVKFKDKDGTIRERARTTKQGKKKSSSQKKKKQPEAEELEHDVKDEIIETLTNENESLKDKLASNGSATPEETEQLLSELRNENKLLRMELKTVKLSRDQFQNENAQLKKQVAALQRQLKKAA